MYKILFLLVTSLCSAQNYRFVYEYKMKPDRKIDSLVTDYMNLDSDGKRSYFYNAAKYERDSLYNVTKNSADLYNGKKYDQNLGYIIEKNYGQKNIKFYDKYKTANLLVLENEPQKWNIEKEFLKINNINCQKATTNYKGRVWEAWFSKEYPINDGPYKFTGLPGLIVSLKDSKGDHSFHLIQIKKNKTVFAFLPKNSKEMSWKDYRKALMIYTSNLADDIEAMSVDKIIGAMNIQFKDGYIAKFDLKELKKSSNQDDEIAKRLRRTNNPIEKE
ncbi:GLPGLI family protein [Chryseobacterium geocarposphaerae]|uniref:GLPGLI family protein n=1 Tax=Chryseobacterium geocarposphaerae TaxID=1416776 RepID=A0A2M9C7C8_9FLAO|nr:GLPGLI family protein [Chryseobacterium geocarposphaerae]PJJ66748.1 GLPGLI family protein [Chryseobacterium geocarposphaerae]